MAQTQLTLSVEGKAVAKAIALVSEALERLDEIQARADIGAHLDLALHRMRSLIRQ